MYGGYVYGSTVIGAISFTFQSQGYVVVSLVHTNGDVSFLNTDASSSIFRQDADASYSHFDGSSSLM